MIATPERVPGFTDKLKKPFVSLYHREFLRLLKHKKTGILVYLIMRAFGNKANESAFLNPKTIAGILNEICTRKKPHTKSEVKRIQQQFVEENLFSKKGSKFFPDLYLEEKESLADLIYNNVEPERRDCYRPIYREELIALGKASRRMIHVYLSLRFWQNTETLEAFPSYRQIGNEIGGSFQNAGRRVKELNENGFIEIKNQVSSRGIVIENLYRFPMANIKHAKNVEALQQKRRLSFNKNGSKLQQKRRFSNSENVANNVTEKPYNDSEIPKTKILEDKEKRERFKKPLRDENPPSTAIPKESLFEPEKEKKKQPKGRLCWDDIFVELENAVGGFYPEEAFVKWERQAIRYTNDLSTISKAIRKAKKANGKVTNFPGYTLGILKTWKEKGKISSFEKPSSFPKVEKSPPPRPKKVWTEESTQAALDAQKKRLAEVLAAEQNEKFTAIASR